MTPNVLLRYFVPEYRVVFVYLIVGKDYNDVCFNADLDAVFWAFSGAFQ